MRFEEYIVRNNPDDALAILRELGAPKPKDVQHMLKLMLKGVEKYPEKAFSLLAEVDTPYKQLILSQQPLMETAVKHSNCSGSSNCAGCKCGGTGVSSYDGGSSNVEGATALVITPAVVNESKDGKTIFVMPSFITQHPIASGVIGTVAVALLIVGAVKLLK